MNKEEKNIVKSLMLESSKYNIDSIGCPNMIVLRSDMRKLYEIIKKLEQKNKQLKEKLKSNEKVRKESIKILKECLSLFPHEFSWEEQAEDLINLLNINKGE